TPDRMSPFYPPTTSGTVRDFVLAQSGTFPYFGGEFGTFIESRPFGTGLPWGAVIVDNAPSPTDRPPRICTSVAGTPRSVRSVFRSGCKEDASSRPPPRRR